MISNREMAGTPCLTADQLFLPLKALADASASSAALLQIINYQLASLCVKDLYIMIPNHIFSKFAARQADLLRCSSPLENKRPTVAILTAIIPLLLILLVRGTLQSMLEWTFNEKVRFTVSPSNPKHKKLGKKIKQIMYLQRFYNTFLIPGFCENALQEF